jgi:hypothetical protein
MTDVLTGHYEGPVRVYGLDGAILTTGRAEMDVDPDTRTWKGMLQVLAGTAVDGKALVVHIETPEGGRGKAQLVPAGRSGDRSYLKIVGLGTTRPF